MTLRPVQSASLPDKVFEQLMSEIVSGRYRPGSAIASERTLSQVFAVNRHVVREALKRLEQVGLVKIVQGGRTTVLDFRLTGGLDLLAALAEHAEAVDELLPLLRAGLEMRAGIGVDVARLCAERATPAIREALLQTGEQLATVARGPELRALDGRFWQQVIDGAGNVAYQLAFNSLIRAVNALPELTVSWLELELERCDYRRPIAAAIAAGDAVAAASATADALAPAIEMLAAYSASSAVASRSPFPAAAAG